MRRARPAASLKIPEGASSNDGAHPQAVSAVTGPVCPSCGSSTLSLIGKDAVDERRSRFQCRSCRWVFFGPGVT
jgi:transposase-like protein